MLTQNTFVSRVNGIYFRGKPFSFLFRDFPFGFDIFFSNPVAFSHCISSYFI